MRSKRAPPSRKMNLRKTKFDVPIEVKCLTGSRSLNSKPTTPKKDKGKLIYIKNQFLAVRNLEGSFYLCRVKQLVYESLNKFLIQWLEEDVKNPGHYNLAYFDHVEPECVVDAVKPVHTGSNRYLLPAEEESRILTLLRKDHKRKGSLKQDDGLVVEGNDDDGAIVIDEDDDDDDDDDEVGGEDGEEEEEMDFEDDDEDFLVPIQLDQGEPASKKPRRSQRSRPATAKSVSLPLTLKRKAIATKVQREKKVLSPAKKVVKPKRKLSVKNGADKLPKKTRSKAASKLNPRPDIKILKNDPLFYSREKVPFISTLAHSKLVTRAVCLKDQSLLESYINDTKHVSELCMKLSVDGIMDSMKMALKTEHLPSVQILNRELTSETKRKRVAMTTGMLTSIETGKYNAASLGGIPHIRQVAASRGCREGNNAFTKSSETWDYENSSEKYLKFCLEQGVSKKMLDQFIFSSGKEADHLKDLRFDYVHHAIKRGHRKLAGEIISDSLKTGCSNFNILHKNVLMFNSEPLQTPLREASVKKMPWSCDKITPIHCAAINPNPLYLSTLLNALPEPGIVDKSNRKPIHYAAACEGTGPLQLLLDRNQDPDEPDRFGMTALMVACQCGRSENVDLILKRATSGENKGGKYGPAGINRPNARFRGDRSEDYFSYAPIHYAVHSNSLESVKVLISHGVDVERGLGPTKNKSTPFMLACSLGHLEVAKVLVQAGADPDKKDKIKRTPTMYASMNGHTHIVSYLLNLGCNSDAQDSSGNTPLQYAAAYGWYFCVKLLLEAGSNPNLANDWKMTPLALAFLKGHIGLADMLLDESDISINFRMEGGVTLVMMACMSSMDSNSIGEQLEYLVVEKKADCTLTDGSDTNALHHLAANRTNASSDEKLMKMATILLENGCDPSAKDKAGLSPLAYAIKNDNLDLASFLIQKGSKITELKDHKGENIFHMLAKQCMLQNVLNTLGAIIKTADRDFLRQMALQVNNNGYCPLLIACREYANYTSSTPYNYNYKNKFDKSLIRDILEGGGDCDDHNDDDDDDDDDCCEEELDSSEPSDVGVEHWSRERKADLVSSNGRLFIMLMIQVAGLQGFTTQVQQKKDQKEGSSGTGILAKNQKSNDDSENDEEDDCSDSSQSDDDGGSCNVDNSPTENHQETEATNTKEKDSYLHWEEAKFTIFHYLVCIKNERPGFFRRLRRNVASKAPCKQRGADAAMEVVVEDDEEEDERMVIVDDSGEAVENPAGRDHEKIRVSCPAFVSALKLYRKMSSEKNRAAGAKNTPLDIENRRGLTPLMVASVENNKEIVSRLAKYAQDIKKMSGSSSSMYKGSSLLLAAKHGSFAVIPELLRAGADPKEVDQRTGCTALHFVIMRKPATETLLELVKCLLDHGSSVDAVDVMKQSPLHKLAKYQRDQRRLLDSAKLLLQRGANLSAKDKWLRTPLHICLAHNPGTINASTKLEELFLSWSSAEVHERDCLGRTPLHYAYIGYEKKYRKDGIDPTSLTSLMTHHSRDPKALVNIQDHELFSPLAMAASIGAGISCIHLIQKGANPELATHLGNTPLALAVAHGHSSCALLLFMRDCNIDQHITTASKEKNDHDDKDDKQKKTEIVCDADCFVNITDEEAKKSEEAAGVKSGRHQRERLPWKFLPNPPEPSKPSLHVYPIIEEIIKQEWQGIISMTLELNQKHSLKLSTMIEASFKTKKYHLAMNLIERSQAKEDLLVMERVGSVWVASSMNLAHKLAKHSSESHHDESIVAVAELLREYKISFSATDHYGCTPLHYACLSLNKPLITFILGLKDTELILRKDNAGRTALGALFWNHINRSDDLFIKIIEQLMAVGLSVDFCCRFAIPKHAFLRFETKFDRKPLDYFDQLLIASSSSRPNAPAKPVGPLTSSKSPSNPSDAGAGKVRRMNVTSAPQSSSLSFTMVMSPLALAIMIENLKLVEVLVALGADVNLGDGWGRSPLMYALALNNMASVRRLLGDQADQKHQVPHIFFDFEELEEKRKARVQAQKSSSHSNSFQLGFKNISAQVNGSREVKANKDEPGKDERNEFADYESNILGITMKYPPILLKSKANLNHVDSQGHSVLHYLVPFGGQSATWKERIGEGDNSIGDFVFPAYDNHVLFLQLESLGARFDAADRKGQTIKLRASRAGFQKLLLAIKHVESQKNVTPVVDEEPHFEHRTISDGVSWTTFENLVNPSQDAHAFLEKFEKQLENSENESPEFKAIPDENLTESKISEVLHDETLNVPFDVLLYKIDVGVWKMGLYNFYKMQVTYQKSKDLYILFTRWGRIGDMGQFQQTPFNSQEEIRKEFKKIFKAKTGNEWENYHRFDEKRSKYRLVSLDSRKPPVNKKQIDINLETKLPSKLHSYIQDLVKELTNVAALRSAMDQTGFDPSAIVFGRIRKKDLEKAKSILEKLEVLAEDFSELIKKRELDIEALEKHSKQMVNLSNEYYHVLPKKGFQYEKLPILNKQEEIQKELANLDLLFDIELATRFMVAAMEKKLVMNPMDYIYKCMDCQILALEETSFESQYLLRYITASWSGRVEAIFKVQRKSDDEKFKDGIFPVNRKLLFHGSNSANLISILTRGLLISPPGVQLTGNLFGNGIYMADTFSKSVNYCYNRGTTKTKFMLVCEANLGRLEAVKESYKSPTEGFDSILGLGVEMPDPAYDVATPSGAVLPLGKIVHNGSNYYRWINKNEYIVYSAERVALRYVIQFRD